MSEPTRLRDGGGSEAARDLVSRSAPSRPMRDDERQRALARLPVAGAAVGAGLLATTKGLALAAVVGAGVGVVLMVGGSSLSSREGATTAAPTPPRATVVAPPASATTPPVTSTDAPSLVPADPTTPPTPASGASAPAPRSTEPPGASSAAGSDAFAREVARLGQARALLGSSPARTLAELDAMAAEFPAGKLGLEREMLRIEALLATGRAGEARSRALALEPRVQGTPYADRLDRLLDRMP